MLTPFRRFASMKLTSNTKGLTPILEDLRELVIESSQKKNARDDSELKPKSQVPLELAVEVDVGHLTPKKCLMEDLAHVQMEG